MTNVRAATDACSYGHGVAPQDFPRAAHHVPAAERSLPGGTRADEGTEAFEVVPGHAERPVSRVSRP
jgi:hypothetical protein